MSNSILPLWLQSAAPGAVVWHHTRQQEGSPDSRLELPDIILKTVQSRARRRCLTAVWHMGVASRGTMVLLCTISPTMTQRSFTNGRSRSSGHGATGPPRRTPSFAVNTSVRSVLKTSPTPSSRLSLPKDSWSWSMGLSPQCSYGPPAPPVRASAAACAPPKLRDVASL